MAAHPASFEQFDPSAPITGTKGNPCQFLMPTKLNLGCSDRLMKGYLNVDLCEPPSGHDAENNTEFFLRADLCERWPWPDSSVAEIMAWDIFEHLPSKLHTMNEAHRVLLPGGRLDLLVPTTDGRGAFQDPTHQSFWTPNDLFYWCENFAEWQRFHVSYGITARYRAVKVEHTKYQNEVWKLHAILEAVK